MTFHLISFTEYGVQNWVCYDGRGQVLNSHVSLEFFTYMHTWLYLLTQVCKSQPKADVDLPIQIIKIWSHQLKHMQVWSIQAIKSIYVNIDELKR